MKKKILTLITICLILVCFSINVFSANEVSQNEIIDEETNSEATNKTLFEQKTEVDNKLNESNSRLEYVKSEISASMQKVQELDDSINDYQNKYNELQSQIASLEAEISSTQNDLTKTEQEYVRKENLLKKRVVALYEGGETTYLDVLLSSKNLFDFLSNYYMLEQIIEFDSNLLNELDEQKQNIEVKKAEQEKKKTDLRVAKAKQGQMQILMENQKTLQVSYASKLSEEEKTKLYEEVHPIALEYRESFIHKDEVIKDTFKTIEQLGFLLIRFPAIGENTSLSGFTIYKAPYNCIYINSRQNLGRQYLSCWHECYHIHTGEGNGISYTENLMEDPIEYKANAFASVILMPDNLVKRYIALHNISLQYLRHEDIIRMQNYFNVGYSAMLSRIIQLYPAYKKNLQNRYAIARNTENQRKLLEEKTKAVHGNLQLIHATNDIYIPDSFYNDITFNLDKKRISKEKAFELLKVVDGLNNDL